MPCHGPKGSEVVHVPAGERTCPDCGGPLVTVSGTQEALFWLHGFGYGEQHVRESCPGCGWYREHESAVRPARREGRVSNLNGQEHRA
jgi:hypothetical protein